MEGFRAPKGDQSKNRNNGETFSEMASATAKKSGVIGKLLVISLIVVSVAVTAFVGYAIVNSSDDLSTNPGSLVNKDQYQAVFLNDGRQVYFGKISSVDSSWLTLEDVYYLQIEQQIQPKGKEAGEQQPKITLVKLGNELHGPEDTIVFSRESVMFWENLKSQDSSKVVEAIEKYVDQKDSE